MANIYAITLSLSVATKQVEAATTSTTVDSDEDDALSYFQKLAEA